MTQFISTAALFSVISLYLMTVPTTAADELERLDAKITANLRNEKWSDQNKAMVRCLWEEYKESHLAGGSQVSSYTTSFGQQRDAEDFEVYIHHFRAIDGRAAFEVTKDGDGRFFVTLDDQATPAVPTARAIQFTTGDVVGAKGVPQLKPARHASLECYEIVRVNGKFYISDLGISDVTSQAVELEVVNQTEAAESKE